MNAQRIEIRPVQIEVPRIRDGSFAPQIVGKRRRLDGFAHDILEPAQSAWKGDSRNYATRRRAVAAALRSLLAEVDAGSLAAV